ncbi:MAG: hypothetical protein ACKVYV_18995 [Limisphaerales bacterium]
MSRDQAVRPKDAQRQRPRRERQPKRNTSALGALGDLVASIDGPADLSSNKRHLAGFGRKQRI